MICSSRSRSSVGWPNLLRYRYVGGFCSLPWQGLGWYSELGSLYLHPLRWGIVEQGRTGEQCGRCGVEKITHILFLPETSWCLKNENQPGCMGQNLGTNEPTKIGPFQCTHVMSILFFGWGACEKAQQWPQALQLLHGLLLREVEPTIISYSATMSACGWDVKCGSCGRPFTYDADFMWSTGVGMFT